MDWHRLLELYSLTNTLILDEDGCYDPCNINDQLILGLLCDSSNNKLRNIKIEGILIEMVTPTALEVAAVQEVESHYAQV